jgi:hypothetical protein
VKNELIKTIIGSKFYNLKKLQILKMSKLDNFDGKKVPIIWKVVNLTAFPAVRNRLSCLAIFVWYSKG